MYACISRVCFCHLWTCPWLYLYFYTELTLLWWYSLICLATAKKACKKTRQQSCYQIKGLQEKQNQNQTIKIAVLQSTSQTSRAQSFSRARAGNTSGRLFMFLWSFCGKSERERGSSTFELGPTTGTGNEKRRTLRKSRLKRKMHFTCADSTTDDREQ